MNAKELRAFAEEIDGSSNGDFEKSVLGGYATIADPVICEKARALARYILATVRDDDDEEIEANAVLEQIGRAHV